MCHSLLLNPQTTEHGIAWLATIPALRLSVNLDRSGDNWISGLLAAPILRFAALFLGAPPASAHPFQTSPGERGGLLAAMVTGWQDHTLRPLRYFHRVRCRRCDRHVEALD